MPLHTNVAENNISSDNIKKLLKYFLRNSYWIILSLTIFIFLAFQYLSRQTPVYKTVAKVLIKEEKGGRDLDILQGIPGIGQIGTNKIENEIEIFRSKDIAERVIRNLGLQFEVSEKNDKILKELYDDELPFRFEILSENQEAEKVRFELEFQNDKILLTDLALEKTLPIKYHQIYTSKDVKFRLLPKAEERPSGKYFLTFNSTSRAAVSLSKAVRVDLTDKSTSVIEFEHNSPITLKSRDIINNLITLYNQDALEEKQSESRSAYGFINDRLRVISNELSDIESRLQDYKIKNQIADVEVQAKLDLETGTRSEAELMQIENQLQLNSSLLSYIQGVGINQLMPVNVGIGDAGVNSTIQTYNNLVLQRNRLLSGATSRNPEVQILTENLQQLRNAVIASMAKYRDNLSKSKGEIQRQRNTVASRISNLPEAERNLRALSRDREIKENLYLLLLKKKQETDITIATKSVKAKVLDSPYTDSQVAPNHKLVYTLAFLLGLILPVLALYILKALDTKIKTREDLARHTQVPILGEIPSAKKYETKVISLTSRTPAAEAFSMLATNIRFFLSGKKKDSYIIYFTSSIKGEGKTYTSINTSNALATKNQRGILIGADIRNPQLQRYASGTNTLLGLSEYLSDDAIGLEDIIQASGFNPNLDIIYSGAIHPNPTLALMSERFPIMLKELCEIYTYVILDTAPVLPVTDTMIVSQYADATFYVTRSNYTESNLLDFMNENASSGKLKNLGLILNDVKNYNLGYGGTYGYYSQGKQNTRFLAKLKQRIFR